MQTLFVRGELDVPSRDSLCRLGKDQAHCPPCLLGLFGLSALQGKTRAESHISDPSNSYPSGFPLAKRLDVIPSSDTPGLVLVETPPRATSRPPPLDTALALPVREWTAFYLLPFTLLTFFPLSPPSLSRAPSWRDLRGHPLLGEAATPSLMKRCPHRPPPATTLERRSPALFQGTSFSIRAKSETELAFQE